MASLIIVFALALVLLPDILKASHAPGFNVRFSETGEVGTDKYIQMPWNVTAAKAKGWVRVVRPEGPKEYDSLEMWCPSDKYTVCVLFDDTEYAAGMQIALDFEKLSNVVFDLAVQGFYNWTTTVNGTTKNYATIQAYYISSQNLSTDPATRIANRNSSKFIQGNEIFANGFNGKVTTIPIYDYKNSIHGYVEANCYHGMGHHYYYNITADTVCAADQILSWLILEDGGEFIGMAFQVFAKIDDSELDWLEYYPGEMIMRSILKAGSDCLYELGNTSGVTILHSWFIDNAYDITC